MTKEQLIDLLVDKAIAHLKYDDAHPDVGMGMFTRTAVDLAEQDVLVEAARWNSLEALRLNFEDVREQVYVKVRQERMQ